MHPALPPVPPVEGSQASPRSIRPLPQSCTHPPLMHDAPRRHSRSLSQPGCDVHSMHSPLGMLRHPLPSRAQYAAPAMRHSLPLHPSGGGPHWMQSPSLLGLHPVPNASLQYAAPPFSHSNIVFVHCPGRLQTMQMPSLLGAQVAVEPKVSLQYFSPPFWHSDIVFVQLMGSGSHRMQMGLPRSFSHRLPNAAQYAVPPMAHSLPRHSYVLLVEDEDFALLFEDVLLFDEPALLCELVVEDALLCELVMEDALLLLLLLFLLLLLLLLLEDEEELVRQSLSALQVSSPAPSTAMHCFLSLHSACLSMQISSSLQASLPAPGTFMHC